MDDLIKLNRRIASHWLGKLDENQEAYFTYASVCIGRLIPSADAITQYLTHPKPLRHNSLAVAKLNRQYLRFARLAALSLAAGNVAMLIRLRMTLEQAEVLSNLTNEAVSRLACGWEGPLVQFTSEAFMRGLALHHSAARYHAAAFFATPWAALIGQ